MDRFQKTFCCVLLLVSATSLFCSANPEDDSRIEIDLSEVEIGSPQPASTSRVQTLEQMRKSQQIYGSCDEVPPNISGVYRIYVNLDETAVVYCEQEFEAGGWTVVLNRFDGSVKFDRFPEDFERGFGTFDGGEFMMGLKLLHQLTFLAPHEMVIQFEDFTGKSMKISTEQFVLGGRKWQNAKVSGRDLSIDYFFHDWSFGLDTSSEGFFFNLFGDYGNATDGRPLMHWRNQPLKSSRIMIRKKSISQLRI